MKDVKEGDFVGVCYWDREPYYGLCKEVKGEKESYSITVQYFRRSYADFSKDVSNPLTDCYVIKRKDIDTLSKNNQGTVDSSVYCILILQGD